MFALSTFLCSTRRHTQLRVYIIIYVYSFKIFLFPARGRCQLWYNTNAQRVPDLQEFIRPALVYAADTAPRRIVSPATEAAAAVHKAAAAAYTSRASGIQP
jgi:hypothetical protein